MTREEIISNLLYMKHSVKEDTIEDITINEAIKALQQEPCTDAVSCNYTTEEIAKSFIKDVESVKDQLDGQPCTDAISRQAAIDGADAIIARDTSGNNDVVKAMTAWKSYVEGLPPVTPAEKVGQWIDIQYFKADDTYYRPKCPFCNTEPKEYSNYCPNCGAKMASPTGVEGRNKE